MDLIFLHGLVGAILHSLIQTLHPKNMYPSKVAAGILNILKTYTAVLDYL